MLLGKMLRVDVDNGGNLQHPEDNPLHSMILPRRDLPGYRNRNPWRFSFDRLPAPCGSPMSAGPVGRSQLSGAR